MKIGYSASFRVGVNASIHFSVIHILILEWNIVEGEVVYFLFLKVFVNLFSHLLLDALLLSVVA